VEVQLNNLYRKTGISNCSENTKISKWVFEIWWGIVGIYVVYGLGPITNSEIPNSATLLVRGGGRFIWTI
jgi:hypothetical protein